jgi:hypothetical protein
MEANCRQNVAANRQDSVKAPRNVTHRQQRRVPAVQRGELRGQVVGVAGANLPEPGEPFVRGKRAVLVPRVLEDAPEPQQRTGAHAFITMDREPLVLDGCACCAPPGTRVIRLPRRCRVAPAAG